MLIVLSALCLWRSPPFAAAQAPGTQSGGELPAPQFVEPILAGVGEQSRRVPGSGLLVQSDPPGAELWLDGILRGTTPLQLGDSLPGPRVLVLAREGYRNRTGLITLEDGKRLELLLRLERATGTILLAPQIPQKDEALLKIFLDGKSVLPGVLAVTEGSHKIRIEAFGYRTEDIAVRVEPDRETVLDTSLEAVPGEVSGLSASQKVFKPATNAKNAATGLESLTLLIMASGPGEAEILLVDAAGAIRGTPVLIPVEGPHTSLRWSPALHLEAGEPPLEDGPVTIRARIRGSSASRELALIADSRIAYAFDEAVPLSGGSLSSPLPPRSPSGAHRFSLALVPGEPLLGQTYPAADVPVAIASARIVPASRWQIDLQARAAPGAGSTGLYAGAGLGTSILYQGPFALGLWLGAGHDFGGSETAGAKPFEAAEGLSLALPLLLSFKDDTMAANISVRANMPGLFSGSYRFDFALGAALPTVLGPLCVSPSNRNVFTLYDDEQNTGWQYSEVGLSLAFRGDRRFASPGLFAALRFLPDGLLFSAGIALEVSLEG